MHLFVQAPIFGFISDRFNDTKLIMIIANMFQIAGSFMYFAGVSSAFIICSRLVGK